MYTSVLDGWPGNALRKPTFLPKFSLALNSSVVMNVRLMWLGRFQLLAWSIPLLLRSSFHAMVLEGLAIAFQSGARGAEGD
jgi:hypothetical protein